MPSASRKTVAVLGGAGYIGAHITLALEQAGYAPVVFDNFSNGHRIFCRDLAVVDVDIRDTARLQNAFATYAPACVIHCAALINNAQSLAMPDLYFDVNARGTQSVLAAMAASGIDSIVFSGTAAVYGQQNTTAPIGENTRLAPISPYGQSKAAAEQAIRTALEQTGIRHAILRYFNAAGADPRGRCGEAHTPETHLIPLALHAVMRLGSGISVFGTDYPTRDGSCIRDYVHVTDLADAHIRACKHLLDGGHSLVCNLGSGHGNSVLEIMDSVQTVTGQRPQVTYGPRRAGDPPFLVADITHARTTLGWQPVKPLSEIMADAWHWHTGPLYRKLWTGA